MAKPACPAPIMTVVRVRMAVALSLLRQWACGGSLHYDRDICRVGHDVIDCRSLLRLRNESFDVLAFCISVNLVGHLDAAKAIANVVVYTENALEVHVPFQGRGDRAQLNVAVLSNRGDTCGQTTCQTNQDVLDWRGTFVLGCKNFRV